MTVAKAQSGHIVFGPNFKWKSLAPIFENLLKTFLKETGQLPSEDEIIQMFVRINTIDLEKNRKPEGWNRRGRVRMVFPLTKQPQMYLKTSTKSAEIVRVTESLSTMLKKSKVSHKVKYDELKHLSQ